MNLTSKDNGQRSGSAPGVCYYCGGGTEDHKEDCVVLKRTVVIRATVEYVVDVPRSWDKHMIEFQRNDGSWCANNDLEALVRHINQHDDRCACQAMTFELLRDATEDDHKNMLDISAP